MEMPKLKQRHAAISAGSIAGWENSAADPFCGWIHF
jgi:hypothetical protein